MVNPEREWELPWRTMEAEGAARGGTGPTYANAGGIRDTDQAGRTEQVGGGSNGHRCGRRGNRRGETVLGPELWVMGPYGMVHKDKGPAAVPTRLVDDMIRQCLPAVVVGRYTARYLDQGMATSGAYVTTSGREGVAQAADSVMQATAGGGGDSEELTVLSLDVGGGEAQAMRCAMEATGKEILVIHAALQRMGPGEIPGGAAIVAMATRQWGTKIVQEADEIGLLGPVVSMGRGQRAEGYRLIALASRCSHMRVWHADPPAIGMHAREGMAKQVRILTQENGSDDVIMELQMAANSAADNGVRM